MFTEGENTGYCIFGQDALLFFYFYSLLVTGELRTVIFLPSLYQVVPAKGHSPRETRLSKAGLGSEDNVGLGGRPASSMCTGR